MRELTALEVDRVGGGSSMTDFMGEGGALGTIYGAVVEGTLAGAGRFGAQGALLGAVFGLSYGTTSWLIDEYYS